MSTVTKCDKCELEIPPGTPEHRFVTVGAIGTGWELRFEVQPSLKTHGDICNDCAWSVLGQALAQYHADKQAEVNRRLDKINRRIYGRGM